MSSKKRKVLSPLEGCTKPKKAKKRIIKENSPTSACKNEEEDIEEKHDVEVIEILDEEKEDLEQDCKKSTNINITPKSSARKNKIMDKANKKSGALTKFLKKTDKKVGRGINHDDDMCELKDEQDCLNKSVHNEESDICNKDSNEHYVESTLKRVSEIIGKLKNDDVTNKSMESYSSCQGSDSDIAILSSDNEMLDDSSKSVTNGNETTSKSASPASCSSPALKDDKDMKKKLTTSAQKQLAKKQEIARRKEEKRRLRMVCY